MINCSATSRLDFCNNPFYGVEATIYPSYSSYRTIPTRCYPGAANSVTSLQSWETYTGCFLLRKESKYKVLPLTYKALHGKAKAYVSELLSLYTPNRPMRPETKNLRVPGCRLEGFGWRCFVYAAPLLWHLLPTLLTLLNMPLPLIPSRAWRLIYLLWHIHRSSDSYFV